MGEWRVGDTGKLSSGLGGTVNYMSYKIFSGQDFKSSMFKPSTHMDALRQPPEDSAKRKWFDKRVDVFHLLHNCTSATLSRI